MKAEHLEFLVEEPSMETFLLKFMPRLVEDRATFTVHVYRGKADLMAKIGNRLRGYAKWLPKEARIVVLIDRDDDCHELKRRLEQEAAAAGLLTRSTAKGGSWRVVNRVVIEELEAWFFGDWAGVQQAYPRVSATIPKHASYRNPDAISGGNLEALERNLKLGGYFSTGLRKQEAAHNIGTHLNAETNNSLSF